MLFVKVNTSNGEKTRRKLAELQIFDADYKIIQKDGVLYFPVKKEIQGFEIIKMRGTKFKAKKPKKIEDALAGKLTKEEITILTTSFDIIGDIAIVEIPFDLEQKEQTIAAALMDVHRNVKVVAKKLGGMEGEFRVRPLKVIAGENRTETEYRESGCRIKLDVAKVYFSVRLSHERERIAEQINDGERILALFAGVGPFPLVIANANKNKKLEIVAIELNPEAVKYMEKNVILNHAESTVKPILGDARAVVLAKYQNWANRIIMPLPKSAEDFLDVAFAGAKNGAVVHFYTFAKEEKAFEESKEKVEKKAVVSGVKIKIVAQRIVRPYAPGVVQVVTDFQVFSVN